MCLVTSFPGECCCADVSVCSDGARAAPRTRLRRTQDFPRGGDFGVPGAGGPDPPTGGQITGRTAVLAARRRCGGPCSGGRLPALACPAVPGRCSTRPTGWSPRCCGTAPMGPPELLAMVTDSSAVAGVPWKANSRRWMVVGRRRMRRIDWMVSHTCRRVAGMRVFTQSGGEEVGADDRKSGPAADGGREELTRDRQPGGPAICRTGRVASAVTGVAQTRMLASVAGAAGDGKGRPGRCHRVGGRMGMTCALIIPSGPG